MENIFVEIFNKNTFSEKSKDKEVVELKDDQKTMDKRKDKETPSYFGYLSGVVSTLWSPAQKVVEVGQEVVQHIPVPSIVDTK